MYVYRKTGNAWPLSATIPLELAHSNPGAPPALSRVTLTINGAGNVLAVGLPGDKHGIDQGENYGAVHVYRETYVSGWRREAIIAPYTGFEFGSSDWVQLDDAGQTLAVHAPLANGGANIYTYDTAGSWSHTGTAQGHGLSSDEGKDCSGFSLSGDGKVIAFTCGGIDDVPWFLETHAAPGWGVRDNFTIPPGTRMVGAALDFTGDLLAVRAFTSTENRVDVFRRTNGAYQREGALPEGAWDASSQPPAPFDKGYGSHIQFSDDGKLLAVSDPTDHAQGTGSLAPPLTRGTEPTGAVYVWERRTSGWVLRRVVKPGRQGAGYAGDEFGASFGLGDNGRTLVVGHPHANNSAGIVWMY